MCGNVQYGLCVYFQKQKRISVASILLNIDFLSAVAEEISLWGFAWHFYRQITFLVWLVGLVSLFSCFFGVFVFVCLFLKVNWDRNGFEVSLHTRQEHCFSKS